MNHQFDVELSTQIRQELLTHPQIVVPLQSSCPSHTSARVAHYVQITPPLLPKATLLAASLNMRRAI